MPGGTSWGWDNDRIEDPEREKYSRQRRQNVQRQEMGWRQ